jgi:hypothetical protein
MLLEKLGLRDTLPMFGTSDNASNMVKGLGQSLLEMYGCNNHTQQLAILDAFKEYKQNDFNDEQTMLDCSDVCKKLSEFLHKSSVGKDMLEHECEVTGHAFKTIHQANDTRWDSRFDNMEGVVYHEECLMRLARQGKFTKKSKGRTYSLVPTISQFRMIKAGFKVLRFCKVTTKQFEQEKVPTLPIVVERFYNMDKEMEQFIDDLEHTEEEMAIDFATVLREKLQRRFPEFGTDRVLNCMANYLNPALKGIHLKLTKKFEATKEEMEDKLKSWKEDSMEVTEEDDDPDDPAEPVQAVKLSPTQLLKQQLMQADVLDDTGASGIRLRISRGRAVSDLGMTAFEKECHMYEKLPDVQQDADLLGWWRNHQEQFPLLSYIVRYFFHHDQNLFYFFIF